MAKRMCFMERSSQKSAFANVTKAEFPWKYNRSSSAGLSSLTGSEELKMNNSVARQLKLDERQAILVTKPNKTAGGTADVLGKYAGKGGRKRRSPDYDYGDYTDYRYSDDGGGHQESDDYRGGSGDDSKKGTYEIHGFREEGRHTPYGVNPTQPAYTVPDEGGYSNRGMSSGRPVQFLDKNKKKLKPKRVHSNEYSTGGDATSSNNFQLNNDEHHHHHYYDDLKHAHYGDKEVLTTHGPLPFAGMMPTVHQKGRHKHYHHIRNTNDPAVVHAAPNRRFPASAHAASYKQDEPITFRGHSNEEQQPYQNQEDVEAEKNFDIAQMSMTDLEDIYKTYDEDIAKTLFADDDNDGDGNAEESSKSLDVLPSTNTKEHVEKIFDNVSKHLNKDAVAALDQSLLDTMPENFRKFFKSDVKIRK